jgi:hypothetical protein
MKFEITTVVDIDIELVVDEMLAEECEAEQAVANVLGNTDVVEVVEDYIITEEQWAPIFDAICDEVWKRIMERR